MYVIITLLQLTITFTYRNSLEEGVQTTSFKNKIQANVLTKHCLPLISAHSSAPIKCRLNYSHLSFLMQIQRNILHSWEDNISDQPLI